MKKLSVLKLMALNAAIASALALSGCGIRISIGGPGHNTETESTCTETLDIESVTYADLAAANSPESIFSRHGSWRAEIEALQDGKSGLQGTAYGANAMEVYCERGLLYLEADLEGIEDVDKRTDFWTKGGIYQKLEAGSKEVLYTEWYAMDDDKKALYIPQTVEAGIIPQPGEMTEEIVGRHDNGDGTVTFITNIPARESGDICTLPPEWEEAVTAYRYTADAATLEIREIQTIVMDGGTAWEYLREKVEYDAGAPDGLWGMIESAGKIEKGEYGHPRTISVTYDPGTEQERTYTKEADNTYWVKVQILPEYALYEDPDGEIPFKGTEELKDITLYAIKE